MISIKDAVRIATEHVAELYRKEPGSGLVLEEAELSADGTTWLVTLALAHEQARSPIEAMTGQELKPRYKIVRIDAESGDVRSVKSHDV